jgi:hypothetical protein
MKEEYKAISLLLEKVNYQEHQWVICVDLKMVNFLLGQQSRYTGQEKIGLRGNIWFGGKNVTNEPLVARDRIILPPLHIKISLMKQFVKALNKDGSCVEHITHKLPEMTMDKLKARSFDGPQIRQLINDPNFIASINEIE